MAVVVLLTTALALLQPHAKCIAYLAGAVRSIQLTPLMLHVALAPSDVLPSCIFVQAFILQYGALSQEVPGPIGLSPEIHLPLEIVPRRRSPTVDLV